MIKIYYPSHKPSVKRKEKGIKVMPRTGENIYKRKDGRWEARYIKYYAENGKAKYGYLYAPTYAEVKSKLHNAIQRVKECSLITEESSTICEKYEYWLNMWLSFKKPRVKNSTYIRYQNTIKNHIGPKLGKYYLDKISTSLMENFIIEIMTDGRINNEGGLSKKSILDILTIIKSTFKFAQSYGATIICNFDLLRIKCSNKEMRVLSKEEEKRLVAILLSNIDRCKIGILLSLYTGIRIGELCALQWKNISLDEKTIRIEQTIQRLQKEDTTDVFKTHLVISSPKSQSSLRIIPLPSFLIEMLEPFLSNPNSFLLSGSCVKVVEPRTMQNRFKKIIRQGEIVDANYHSLRHTFATRCVEAGFDVKSLSEILGHSSVKITLDKYVHSSLEQKRLCMDKLNLSGY